MLYMTCVSLKSYWRFVGRSGRYGAGSLVFQSSRQPKKFFVEQVHDVRCSNMAPNSAAALIEMGLTLELLC